MRFSLFFLSCTVSRFVFFFISSRPPFIFFFFFFNDTATTEIYTLSLHDALPIFLSPRFRVRFPARAQSCCRSSAEGRQKDRKSTRLNSSHGYISYAVFCLKKKKITNLQKNLSLASNTHLLVFPSHTR